MNFESMSCRMRSWLRAGGCGLLLAILLWLSGSWGFWGGLFLGLCATALIGLVLVWAVCEGDSSAATTGGGTAEVGAATGNAAHGAGMGASGAGAAAVASGVSAERSRSGPDPAEPGGDAAEGAATDTTATRPDKGERVDASKPDPVGPEAHTIGRTDTPAVPEADAEAGASVTPSEAREPSAVGTRPLALDGPRDEGADDLKQIRGVGPKLESQLHEMGFYHFDQIADWNADEVAWVDENLPGFRGRVSRDDWVGQARALVPQS